MGVEVGRVVGDGEGGIGGEDKAGVRGVFATSLRVKWFLWVCWAVQGW